MCGIPRGPRQICRFAPGLLAVPLHGGDKVIRLKQYTALTGALRARTRGPRRGDWSRLRAIKEFAQPLASADECELRDLADQLRDRVIGGADVHSADIVTLSFALTYESVRRTLGVTYYDVQILAGLALANGAVAEMATGEGKTLVAALPAVLHSLGGNGVHVATVNSYLARRDFELLRPAFELLGLTVGLVVDDAPPPAKKAAYDCDITYATGYQLGFDYLHDQIELQRHSRQSLGESYLNCIRYSADDTPVTMQRGHRFAIIDEIDSVLIDEATTPLILSGTPNRHPAHVAIVARAQNVAATLRADSDFSLERKTKRIELTERGAAKVYGPDVELPPDGLARPWSMYVEQALRAAHFLTRDVDYVVQGGKVLLVDQYTGRIFSERSWSDGLHQAVEAKEGVAITDERCAVARISRQRYFRLYDNICGMTGTASGNENEFLRFYGLPVVRIPLRKRCCRREMPPRFFADLPAKAVAVAADVAQRHQRGQPVLIGTRTIRHSLQISDRLTEARLPHRVLNGVQDDDEAELIAEAGRPGAITIATNMAGRGTDIKPPRKAIEAGGLHVIATEYHESPRIDRQLIGRSARQGDPGSCQFLIAADDELFERFDLGLQRDIQRDANRHGEARRDFSKPVEQVQRKCERRDYTQRQKLLRQEKWLEDVLETVAKE